MYLHIGQNEILPDRRIIGIFDLDKCSYGKRTREYLAAAEKEGVVLDVSGEIPKSFVVCDHPYHRQIVYLSQLNSSTLKNRAESGSAGALRGGGPCSWPSSKSQGWAFSRPPLCRNPRCAGSSGHPSPWGPWCSGWC